MTDSTALGIPAWLPVVHDVSRRSGHELRNSLNGLIVNLEVVRSRFGASGSDVSAMSSFLDQAAYKAEESARLAEAALALLDLVLGAVAERGELQCESITPHRVRVAASGPAAERTLQSLRVLAGAAGVQSEADDSAIILTIPQQSSADPD